MAAPLQASGVGLLVMAWGLLGPGAPPSARAETPGSRRDASPSGREEGSPGPRRDASPSGREEGSPGPRRDASPSGREEGSLNIPCGLVESGNIHIDGLTSDWDGVPGSHLLVRWEPGATPHAGKPLAAQ